MRFMDRIGRLCAISALMIAIPLSAADAPPVATCSSKDLSVERPSKENKASTGGALKQTITVIVKGLSSCLQKKSPLPKFVLYLDGHPLRGLVTAIPGVGHDHLQFFLDRVAENKDSWAALLRDPTLDPRNVELSVAMDADQPIKSDFDNFELRVVNGSWLTGWTVLFAFLLVLFFWAARSSNILRESGPPPPKDKDGNQPDSAYSLARCQMAFWFFLIAMAFCLIFMITWDLGSISQGVLALMGISAGTGLAAAIVDASKNGESDSKKKDLLTQKALLDADIQKLQSDTAPKPAGADVSALNQQLVGKQQQATDVQSKIQQIDAQLATSATDGIVNDLLHDATGLSFHRFQMVVWTVIMGIVFVVSVWSDLIMPEFNATMLGLMGISAGTYIGFKFPEQKNPVATQPAKPEPPAAPHA